MEIRRLTSDAGDTLRSLARRSLEASYTEVLDEAVISEAVENWYGGEAIEEYLDSDEMLFLLAEDRGELVGFSQSHVLEDINKGRILWLHVDPDHRTQGTGETLLAETRGALHDRGIDAVTAVVLKEHQPGVDFYERYGFEPLATRRVTIGGEEYEEFVLREPGIEYDPLEMRLTPDGQEVFIDFDESDRGSDGPFCAVFLGPRRERRWGWFCTNCESFSTSMDTMGRIQCEDCGNTRRPTRWDASYL